MPCARCGGLMVAEHFSGGDTMIEFWAYQGLRCVNCGAIVETSDLSLLMEVGRPISGLSPGAEGAS